MKTKFKVYLTLFTISIILCSCVEKDFNIVGVQQEITAIKTYSLSSSIEESESGFKPLELRENYPNLNLWIELKDKTVQLAKISLANKDKSLIWEIEPEDVSFDESQNLVIDNINLASYYFDSGLYDLKLLSEDGRELINEISISNELLNHNTISIYLKNEDLIFSLNDQENLENIEILKELSDKSNLEIIFYDTNKEKLNSNYYLNKFKNQNYPFKLKIDNFELVKYVEIKYKDANNVLNIIKVDLSSTDSFL